MFLHVFAHVDADHVLRIIKQNFRQSFGQFRLAYAGRPQEDKGTDGTVGILDARTGADHRIRHSLHRFILSHHMFMQRFFQMNQLFPFTGSQPLHRNPRPGAHYTGNILFIHFFLQQRVFADSLVFQGLQLFLQFRQAPVLQFRQLVQVIVPLGLLHLLLYGADFLLHFTNFYNAGLFIVPALDQGCVFFPQFGQLLLQLHQTIRRCRVFFFFQGLLFNFQLQNLTLAFINLRRRRINFRTEPGRRFIHQVNGLIRQEPVVDVPLAHHCRSYQRGVLDPYAVMVFIAFLQAAENRNGIFHAGLVDHDRLEPALQGAVLFNIFMVFI